MEFTDVNQLPELNSEEWVKNNYTLLNSSDGYGIKALKTSTSDESYALITIPFTVFDTGSSYINAVKFVDKFSLEYSGTKVSQLLDIKTYAYVSIEVLYKPDVNSSEEDFFTDTHYIPYLLDSYDSTEVIEVEDPEQYLVDVYTAEQVISLRQGVIPIQLKVNIISIKTDGDREVEVHVFKPALYRSKTVSEQAGSSFGGLTGLSIANEGIVGYYYDDNNVKHDSFNISAGQGNAAFSEMLLRPLFWQGDAGYNSNLPYGGRLRIQTTGRMLTNGVPAEGIVFDSFSVTGTSWGAGAYINTEYKNAKHHLYIHSEGETLITSDRDLSIQSTRNVNISGANITLSTPEFLNIDALAVHCSELLQARRLKATNLQATNIGSTTTAISTLCYQFDYCINCFDMSDGTNGYATSFGSYLIRYQDGSCILFINLYDEERGLITTKKLNLQNLS